MTPSQSSRSSRSHWKEQWKWIMTTIERVFKQIDPKIFLQCFMEWTQLIAEIIQNGVIAIDGKTMRVSYDNVNGKKALHMVSAWFSETGITYGQVKTSEKSNEITAIPKLIALLDLTGQIVTTDAMLCKARH
jgi:hypothetical protein